MIRHLNLHNAAAPAKRIPGWLANLLLFGLLIVIVLGAFFWQMSRISIPKNGLKVLLPHHNLWLKAEIPML